MIKFSDGVNLETGGPARAQRLEDGWYCVGRGCMIPCSSLREAQELAKELNSSEEDDSADKPGETTKTKIYLDGELVHETDAGYEEEFICDLELQFPIVDEDWSEEGKVFLTTSQE